MPGYRTREQTFTVGAHDFAIRSLLDRNEYDDEDGRARALGIDENGWSLFGVMWDSGLSLARHVDANALAGRRILEIGCGLALPGLVAHRALADVTVSDRHPLTEGFLRHNERLNGLRPMPYRTIDWDRIYPALGRFDLILASDVAYLPEHAAGLAGFVDRTLTADGEVWWTNPARDQGRHVRREFTARGFGGTDVTRADQGLCRTTSFRRDA